jgi:hypothetical protein
MKASSSVFQSKPLKCPGAENDAGAQQPCGQLGQTDTSGGIRLCAEPRSAHTIFCAKAYKKKRLPGDERRWQFEMAKAR